MLAIKPTTLATDKLVLRPLALDDVPALAKAAADGALWDKTNHDSPAPGWLHCVCKARAGACRNKALRCPSRRFSVTASEVIGSTRFMNIDAANHRVEIGTTWIAGSWQRTFVNTHAKFLMLKHAFEDLGCNAVELRTHSQNGQSRAAIERLGAKFDGILRRHMIMPDGHIRDTAVYSIVKEEWPGVRERLESKLDR